MLNDSEVSYAELRGHIMIRPAGTRGAVKDKVKVKTTDVSRFFFGASNVSLRWCCRCGYPYDVRNMISQQDTRCRKVAYVIGGIYDAIEWPRGHSDYLADHSSIQILNRPTFFGCFIEKLLVNNRIYDASFQPSRDSGLRSWMNWWSMNSGYLIILRWVWDRLGQAWQ